MVSFRIRSSSCIETPGSVRLVASAAKSCPVRQRVAKVEEIARTHRVGGSLRSLVDELAEMDDKGGDNPLVAGGAVDRDEESRKHTHEATDHSSGQVDPADWTGEIGHVVLTASVTLMRVGVPFVGPLRRPRESDSSLEETLNGRDGGSTPGPTRRQVGGEAQPLRDRIVRAGRRVDLGLV